MANRNVISLAINDSNRYIFAGTDNEGVFRSTNNGTNWTRKVSNLTNLYVSALAINADGNIFAGTGGGGVFLSTTNGDTWSQTGLRNTWVHSLAINSTGNLFAGTRYDGIFRSGDNGNNWTQTNSGFTANFASCIAINDGGYVFVGTLGSSVFRSVGSTTSVKESGENIPTKFSLSQNYPNPFNPTTTIEYSIPRASLVKMQVYDILGREVATLINEVKSAGTYTATFNAANIPSGVYFYRLQAGSFTETKKLILLR